MTVIDVHAHVLPQSAMRAYQDQLSWYGTTITKDATTGFPALQTGDRCTTMGSLDYWLPPEARIHHMDAAGVDIQVLSMNPQLFRYTLDSELAIAAARAVNDELADTVRLFPNRFRALATLPLQSPSAAIAELQRAVNELGLSGAIVGTHVGGANWDEPQLVEVLEAANELGAFVFIHPLATRIRDPLPRFHMKNLIGNPAETTIAAGSLIFSGLMNRLDRVNICLAHGGGYAPWAIGRFDHGYASRPESGEYLRLPPSSYLRRFYFDTLTHSRANLQYMVEHIGADRLVVGTDFPADMGEREPVKWLESCDFLSTQDRSDILGGTLGGLLGIPRKVRIQ